MHPIHVSCDRELTAANKLWGDQMCRYFNSAVFTVMKLKHRLHSTIKVTVGNTVSLQASHGTHGFESIMHCGNNVL